MRSFLIWMKQHSPTGSRRIRGCPTVGIADLTLGGGKCHLMPKDCAACDKSAVRENSDGRLETDRSQSEIHSRILWAIRGGGGNFGVATALEDQLHPDSLKRL